MLSTPCEYGIRALIFIAAKSNEENYISINQVSEELGISKFYLTKILQRLSDSGILVSHKGPKGGVRLAKVPEDINLYEVIEIFDGKDKLFDGCVMGLPGCGTRTPCPMHNDWASIRESMRIIFMRKNLKLILSEVTYKSDISELLK